MSTLLTAETLLRQHGIDYVATRNGKFTTGCPECGQGYLNVVVDGEGAKWFCHHCNEGGGARFEKEERKDAPKNALGPIRAVYDYTDEAGTLLFQCIRFEPVNAPKQFRQRKSPDQEKWSIAGVRLVPYRLPQLIEAIAHENTVFIVEGEKDVDSLSDLGIASTCNPMGAGKWRADFSETLRGADVVLCGDNDAAGKDHIDKVAASLHGVAARIRRLDLCQHWPEIEQSGDISDWLDEPGHTAQALWTIVEELPDYRPKTNGGGGDPIIALLATLYSAPKPEDIPPRAWLYGGHYIRDVCTATVAPGGWGKTTLTLFEALTMASQGLRVWYLSGEDPKVEIDRRLAAHCKHHNLDFAEFVGQLFVDDQSSFPLFIGNSPRTASVLFNEKSLGQFEQAIIDCRIDVVMLDPFVSFHAVPENDNGAIDAVCKRLAAISYRQHCCIEISHHVRKSAPGQITITVDDTRGGGAIVNAVRSSRVINRMSGAEAEQAKIEGEHKSSYIRLDRGKRNMAPADAANWFHIVSVQLANGDNVQSLECWDFPKLREVTEADTDWLKSIVRNKQYRTSSKSPDWLGVPLAERFDLDLETKSNVIFLNKTIKKWKRNGILQTVKAKDESRREREFFAVKESEVEMADIIDLPWNDGNSD